MREESLNPLESVSVGPTFVLPVSLLMTVQQFLLGRLLFVLVLLFPGEHVLSVAFRVAT